jgi:hypothetical protein
MLSPEWQYAFAALNVLPLPGLGAVLAGWRNAHTTLRRNGALQMLLVVFGSWPLIGPGVAGLAWAIVDAVRIAKASPVPRPPRNAPLPPP